MRILTALLWAGGLGLGLAALAVCVLAWVRHGARLRAAGSDLRASLLGWPWRKLRWVGAGGALMLLGAAAFVVVPAGQAGVRVSSLAGVRPGTLYPGVHLVVPLVESVVLFDTRDQLLATGKGRNEPLQAQSREGLSVGLSVSVRYRLDPQRLASIYANLPQPVESELVPPVVESAFRDLLPRYLVREIFADKREEVRSQALAAIVSRLAADGVVVKEVLLRDVALPPEYSKGLESLLLKEQESQRMVFELQVKQQQVRRAELEAEADKAREVKAAEGQAQVRVLQAKAEADAMQHTLPLKEKQIQQTRLEAQARKEATVMNAEAAGEAKVIDGKAELQRLNLMAEAEAHRIRVTSEAELERMRVESAALKDNPLLIQKIVAERLSDKLQIMMVPMDGSNFFASEIFRSAALGGSVAGGGAQEDKQRRPRR